MLPYLVLNDWCFASVAPFTLGALPPHELCEATVISWLADHVMTRTHRRWSTFFPSALGVRRAVYDATPFHALLLLWFGTRGQEYASPGMVQAQTRTTVRVGLLASSLV